jgi:hypothetical protein
VFRRVVLIALVLVTGTAAADTRARRVVRSYRTCDMAECPDNVKKLYEQEPTLELVTMGIGSLIWERHGHIAMCARWQDQAKDICFNYGIGSFDKPLGMAWGFFRGTDSFWAGEQTVESIINIYAGRNRTVWVQPLPLTAAQKEVVLDALYRDTAPMRGRELMRPEKWRNSKNLHYAYDHFVDNCTTRVRDILDQAIGGKFSALTGESDRTFRELARDGFQGMRIPLLITDIAMGRSTDRVPDYWERMFLPQYLREAATRVWPEIKPVIIYQRDPALERPELANVPGVNEDADGNGLSDAEEDKDHNSGRVLFAIVILLLTAPAPLTRYFNRFRRTGMAIAVIPYWLLGSILWFLAIISPLPYVMWNESLLVLLPLDLALLFLRPERRRIYARARVAMLGAFALLSLIGVFSQPLIMLVLWPLVPNAVVGFWKDEWSRPSAEKTKPDAKPAKAEDKKAS